MPLAAQVPDGYPSQGQGTCGSMELVEQRIALTQVGELRSEEDTVKAHFTYGKRADSSVTTALRRSGANWSASGEHKTANMAEDAVGWQVDHGPHMALDTEFYYGRFRCSMGAEWEMVKAIEWKGATALYRPLEPRGCGVATDDEMSKQGPNTDFHRNSEKAGSISRAATVFGFTFGSQSGYSQWVRADWFFGPAEMHYICGDGAAPRLAPRIFAGIGNSAGPACRPGRPC